MYVVMALISVLVAIIAVLSAGLLTIFEMKKQFLQYKNMVDIFVEDRMKHVDFTGNMIKTEHMVAHQANMIDMLNREIQQLNDRLSKYERGE